MERKILFKAKRLDNGEWVKGDLTQTKEGKAFIHVVTTCFSSICPVYQVDPSTVCQFTGLKDKDGKPIWEHDILEDTDTDIIGEVTFGCGVFAIDCLPVSEYIYDGVFDLKVVCSKFDRMGGEK